MMNRSHGTSRWFQGEQLRLTMRAFTLNAADLGHGNSPAHVCMGTADDLLKVAGAPSTCSHMDIAVMTSSLSRQMPGFFNNIASLRVLEWPHALCLSRRYDFDVLGEEIG